MNASANNTAKQNFKSSEAVMKAGVAGNTGMHTNTRIEYILIHNRNLYRQIAY